MKSTPIFFRHRDIIIRKTICKKNISTFQEFRIYRCEYSSMQFKQSITKKINSGSWFPIVFVRHPSRIQPFRYSSGEEFGTDEFLKFFTFID